MYGNYKNMNKSSNESNLFNISGQNIMGNKRNIDDLIKENKQLKLEINRKDKEINDARKRINIIEKEIERYKRQNNTNIQKGNKMRGKSVGIRKNVNSNNNNGFFGGIFNNNDPFNDSFFRFPDEMKNNDNDSFMDNKGNFGFF